MSEMAKFEGAGLEVLADEKGVAIYRGEDGPDGFDLTPAQAAWLFRTAGPSVLLAIRAQPALRGPVAPPPDRG